MCVYFDNGLNKQNVDLFISQSLKLLEHGKSIHYLKEHLYGQYTRGEHKGGGGVDTPPRGFTEGVHPPPTLALPFLSPPPCN